MDRSGWRWTFSAGGGYGISAAEIRREAEMEACLDRVYADAGVRRGERYDTEAEASAARRKVIDAIHTMQSRMGRNGRSTVASGQFDELHCSIGVPMQIEPSAYARY